MILRAETSIVNLSIVVLVTIAGDFSSTSNPVSNTLESRERRMGKEKKKKKKVSQESNNAQKDKKQRGVNGKE